MKESIIAKRNFASLNCFNFGQEDCKKSHFFGPAVRMYWLIHYVESGCGIFRINGKTYNVRQGELFVIPPFVETYYEADSETPWSYSWIGFTYDGDLPLELADVIYCPQARDVFKEMQHCNDSSKDYSTFLIARIWDLFYLLLENQKVVTDYIEVALSYIHSEYMNDISVTQLAADLSLDRSYFSTLFKERIGMSPGKYILNYRMEIASKLMVENGKSVTVAANSVGYTDIYNFSRMFKQRFGISPRGYVKKHKEKS